LYKFINDLFKYTYNKDIISNLNLSIFK